MSRYIALATADVSQTPVLPLVDRAGVRTQLVSGHYADEFAASHRTSLVVRVGIGAGLPLAGVGCAVRTDALRRLAAREGEPFEAASLTEDYEQGLRLSALGCRARFMRVRGRGGSLVATSAFFPSTLAGATSQKARWMTGIALAGWDRIGWAHPLALGEHWMRMRDRRAPLATLVVAVGYVALTLDLLSLAIHALERTAPSSVSATTRMLVLVDLGLLVWRSAMRVVHTERAYGWGEAAWAVPRMVVGNAVAVVAVCRALARYLRVLRGGEQRWNKTEHVFPDLAAEPSAR